MSKSALTLTASLVLSLAAIVLAAIALLRTDSAPVTTGPTPVGPQMSTNFGAQVRGYLLDNPEVIFEAAELYEERQRATAANEVKLSIGQHRDEIFNSPDSPVTGNAQGDVRIVEFFDYNCPYCRAAIPMLAEAMAADPGIAVVHKEWPILGAGSQFAALAALASVRQGRYEAFHQAMMAFSGAIDEASTLQIARDIGLDVDRLRLDMEDPAIRNEVERNYQLSGTLRITGTPTFVIGDEIVVGLVDLATLQGYVAEARTEAAGGR